MQLPTHGPDEASDPPEGLPARLLQLWEKEALHTPSQATETKNETPHALQKRGASASEKYSSEVAPLLSASTGMKLLIVDSDRNLVEMLTGWLKTLGYDVHRAYTAERAKIEWIEQRPDLVLLDTALKGVDMLALCRELRTKHDALILVVTDGKDVQDEVHCLESGADDYLRKPFFPSQLLARIRAVSRRARSTLERRPSSIITVGPICVDSLHNEVTMYGKTSRLTPTESKLLHLLAVNANDVCTADQIVTHVWGYNGDADATLIKAHIRHLRQKIEPNPAKPYYILTVPGVGYTLMQRSAGEQEVKEARRPLRAVSSL